MTKIARLNLGEQYEFVFTADEDNDMPFGIIDSDDNLNTDAKVNVSEYD